MADKSVVVVTGASKGVGAAVAVHLAKLGRIVIATARDERKLSAVARKVRPARGRGIIIPMAMDVTNPAQVAVAYDRIEEDFGPIGVLINNAAVFEMKPFHQQDLETLDAILDTNLRGLMYATRLVLPYMMRRKQGRVINIASVAGVHGIPGQAAYCASKHGVVGFGDALAQELIPHGILVTTLCPGGIDTPLWRDGNSPYPGDLSKTMKPQELADLIAFLLAQPATTLHKKMVFFPTNEWH